MKVSILLLGLACTTVVADTHYVDLTCVTPVAPYTNWAMAANGIQDAVDVASSNDTVLVTDGTYFLNSEITVSNAIAVMSVNGAKVTLVNGRDSCRGFNLMNAPCTITGFTVTNCYTYGGGGGILCYNRTPVITDCILIGNSARWGGGSHGGSLYGCKLIDNAAYDDDDGEGGGSYESTLSNCMLISNWAECAGGGSYDCVLTSCVVMNNSSYIGGGCRHCILKNCTVVNNWADRIGGCGSCELNNCIVWGNTLGYWDDADVEDTAGSTLSYTCSSDALHGVDGNITNNPPFLSSPAGNYHLLPGSPCIDSGTNAYVFGSTDLDGYPRIVNSTVDMGAYEYDAMVYDSDGDAQTDFEEYVADTDPVDSSDWFHISSNINNTVHFNSSSNRLYTLLWSSNLVEGIWAPVTDRMGVGGEDSMNSTNALPTEFYKLEVEIP